jgi:predicted nuclease of predicted toxin-antitoxin system
LSLLLDENLSPRLAAHLESLFPCCIHVRDVGPKQAGLKQASLKQADDREFGNGQWIITTPLVTTDSDFVAMVTQTGPPPKVIHIEPCDFPFSVIEDPLRQNAIRAPGLKTRRLPGC